MKTLGNSFLKIFVLISISFLPFYALCQSNTEEYAVISVSQRGKKNFISIQIGAQATQEKEFQMEKEDKRYDLAPIIEEMQKLNAQGFEAINFSNAIIPAGQYGGGFPFYTIFMIKRK